MPNFYKIYFINLLSNIFIFTISCVIMFLRLENVVSYNEETESGAIGQIEEVDVYYSYNGH